MCFFFSFMPATFWIVIGYFVLFSSTKADGSVKTFGRGLAIWAFFVAGFIVVAGAYVTLSGMCPIGALMNCAS
jgi:hypothetical protein